MQVLFQSNKHSLLIYSSSQEIGTIIGIPFTEEKHQEEFSYSVVLFEKKCLPKPKLLLYNSVIPLAAILLTLLVMALMAPKVAQLRLMICEHFFSAAAEARVEYLHAKILKKRLKQRVCCITSTYFKVCITTYHWLNRPNCMMLHECNCYFRLPLSATFLVPSDLQTQREATNCCVIVIFCHMTYRKSNGKDKYDQYRYYSSVSLSLKHYMNIFQVQFFFLTFKREKEAIACSLHKDSDILTWSVCCLVNQW